MKNEFAVRVTMPIEKLDLFAKQKLLSSYFFISLCNRTKTHREGRPMTSKPIITKDVLKSIFENISDNELFVCSLCACMCTNQNRHQLVSTQCGHLFGKNCIRKHLKETHQCPSCFKSLATRHEQQLRSMCLSSVVTIFPIEISRMREERKRLRLKLNDVKTRLERAKTKLTKNKQHLQMINQKLLNRQKRHSTPVVL